ncbi:NAD(P)-binding protein [Gymnopus androsaceus JB14]|uniref:NAD(P)-binding protein n=1 Tax=Gymnopus androsaceus JB14 TaxID=1447944 RepID=A0A6A4ID53_9AGAR|nr:NAD(P)-binding protein [Gymnopus androsaceus JB14]
MASPLPTTSLTEKVAVVTGSSRGIGAAIALRLAEEGAKVVVNYFGSAQAADQVVQQIKSSGKGDAVAVKADTSTIEGGQSLIDEAIKTFGKLDIVVLNAGAMHSQVLADIDENSYNMHMNFNVKGPLFMAQAAAKRFPPSGGLIIFLSNSVTGLSAIGPDYLIYAMSKVSPGPVDTALFREGKPQQLLDIIAGMHPPKRIGQPEEVAPIVAFLANPAAQWINGQNIKVNGGFVV